MRLPIPPLNPVTEQFLGEDNVRWQERDEAAKQEQKRFQEQNATYRSMGMKELPEPDWKTWRPLAEVLAEQAGSPPPLAPGAPQPVDPTHLGRMDHLGWQQLSNLEQVGKLVEIPLPRDLDSHLGPLPPEAGNTIAQLVFQAKAGSPPAARRGKMLGGPGQGTHDYNKGPDNWQSDHAVDMALPEGTRILAISDGKISTTWGFGDTGKGGRFEGSRLHLEFGNDVAYYAHLKKIVVQPGQHVKAGQLLGYSGSASGVPHLHFATEDSNPLTWVRGNGGGGNSGGGQDFEAI